MYLSIHLQLLPGTTKKCNQILPPPPPPPKHPPHPKNKHTFKSLALILNSKYL